MLMSFSANPTSGKRGRLLYGNCLVLEYFQDVAVARELADKLNQVIFGYRKAQQANKQTDQGRQRSKESKESKGARVSQPHQLSICCWPQCGHSFSFAYSVPAGCRELLAAWLPQGSNLLHLCSAHAGATDGEVQMALSWSAEYHKLFAATMRVLTELQRLNWGPFGGTAPLKHAAFHAHNLYMALHGMKKEGFV